MLGSQNAIPSDVHDIFGAPAAESLPGSSQSASVCPVPLGPTHCAPPPVPPVPPAPPSAPTAPEPPSAPEFPLPPSPPPDVVVGSVVVTPSSSLSVLLTVQAATSAPAAKSVGITERWASLGMLGS